MLILLFLLSGMVKKSKQGFDKINCSVRNGLFVPMVTSKLENLKFAQPGIIRECCKKLSKSVNCKEKKKTEFQKPLYQTCVPNFMEIGLQLRLVHGQQIYIHIYII